MFAHLAAAALVAGPLGFVGFGPSPAATGCPGHHLSCYAGGARARTRRPGRALPVLNDRKAGQPEAGFSHVV